MTILGPLKLKYLYGLHDRGGGVLVAVADGPTRIRHPSVAG